MSAERELLKRLVELKDRKDVLQLSLANLGLQPDGPTAELLAKYRRKKDAAWAEARELLAQPERKPLTRDQLRNIWPEDDMSFGAFQLAADAIERAHGIE